MPGGCHGIPRKLTRGTAGGDAGPGCYLGHLCACKTRAQSGAARPAGVTRLLRGVGSLHGAGGMALSVHAWACVACCRSAPCACREGEATRPASGCIKHCGQGLHRVAGALHPSLPHPTAGATAMHTNAFARVRTRPPGTHPSHVRSCVLAPAEQPRWALLCVRLSRSTDHAPAASAGCSGYAPSWPAP